jgi:hypothetical protein
MIREKGKFEIKLYDDKWKSLSEAFAEARKMKNLKTDNFATQEAPEVIPLAEEPLPDNNEPPEDVIPVVLEKDEECTGESAPEELDEAYMVDEESPAEEEPPVSDDAVEEEEEPPVVEEPEEEPPATEVKEEPAPPVEQELKDGDDLEVTQESIKVNDEEVKKAQEAAAEEEKMQEEAAQKEVEEPEVEEEEKSQIEQPEPKESKPAKKEPKSKKESRPADKESDAEDIDLDDLPIDDEEMEFSEEEEDAIQDEDENILDKMEDDEHRTEEIQKKDTAVKKRTSEDPKKTQQREGESMNQKPKIRYIPQTVKPKKLAKKKTALGEPINFRGLRYAPVSREGVIFIFGMVSHELGFVVEALRPDLPDCEGTRYVDEGGQEFERVRMCFCHKSSDFRGEDEGLCDLIICWHHDWDDPPLEILELSDAIKYLSE